ncbi:MAG: HD domain-containing protein [Oligoflexales bacterium]|nr:HD domain-containing protein [Oligoflexales bacterium]
MNARYQLKEETRNRCRIWPVTEDFLSEFRIITMDRFNVFYESAYIDFSLYLQVGKEIVEYIKPAEYVKRALLDHIREVMVKEHEHVRLLIRNSDEKKFIDICKQISQAKAGEIVKEDPALDRKTVEAFTDLTSISQLVVKGGLTADVVDTVAKTTSRMMNSTIGNKSVISTLSRMINNDPTLYDHSASVAMIAGMIATTILASKISLDDAKIVALCGIYHDVGKSDIPNHILNKPGKYEPFEFEIMKTHSQKGYDEITRIISDGAPIPEIVARVALEHHEKFSGSGYPNGKKGRAEDDKDTGIHLYSRIMMIADVYSALLMKRVYKPAYDPIECVKIMAECSGDYDPDIIRPFLAEVVKSLNHYNEQKKINTKGRLLTMENGKLTVVDNEKKSGGKAS